MKTKLSKFKNLVGENLSLPIFLAIFFISSIVLVWFYFFNETDYLTKEANKLLGKKAPILDVMAIADKTNSFNNILETDNAVLIYLDKDCGVCKEEIKKLTKKIGRRQDIWDNARKRNSH